MGGNVRETKGPDGGKQFSHEEAREDQANDAKSLESIVPAGVRFMAFAYEKLDDEVWYG